MKRNNMKHGQRYMWEYAGHKPYTRGEIYPAYNNTMPKACTYDFQRMSKSYFINVEHIQRKSEHIPNTCPTPVRHAWHMRDACQKLNWKPMSIRYILLTPKIIKTIIIQTVVSKVRKMECSNEGRTRLHALLCEKWRSCIVGTNTVARWTHNMILMGKDWAVRKGVKTLLCFEAACIFCLLLEWV